MTLKLHISDHNDDLHNTTAKRNLANGVAGLDASGNLFNSYYAGLLEYYTLSNNIIHSHDNLIQTTSLSYVKLKTITINELHPTPSTIRISFRLYTYWGPQIWGRIYKNGVGVGTERATTSSNTFIEDISFDKNDTVEIWGKSSWGTECRLTNFRILGNTELTLKEAINNHNTGITDAFIGTNS